MKMNMPSRLVISFLVLFSDKLYGGESPPAAAASASKIDSTKVEGQYAGTWVTTKNKKLDGTATCDVRQISPGHWQGRFWGVWQHVPFDYTVKFQQAKSETSSPPPPELTAARVPAEAKTISNPVAGEAVIDGAHYDWTGNLTAEKFEIQFTGTRYEGHLDLARLPDKPPTVAGKP